MSLFQLKAQFSAENFKKVEDVVKKGEDCKLFKNMLIMFFNAADD